MTLPSNPNLSGLRLSIITMSFVLLFSASIATAQESNSDTIFDDAVLELLLESRLQKPAAQASSAERVSAIEELTNIYLISSLPRALELGESSAIKVQLDLQERAILSSNSFSYL